MGSNPTRRPRVRALGVVVFVLAGMAYVVGSASAANAMPANSVPGPQTTAENTALVFSAANTNAITIADPDNPSSNEQAELTVANGTLTVGSTDGVSVSGNGTADVTVTAPLDAINSALDGLSYAPNQYFHGSDTLTLNTNDLGNGTAGGPFTDMSSVQITVNDTIPPTAVNDAFSTNENVSLTTGNVLTNDSDPDGDTLTAVQVTGPTNGSLTLNSDGTFTYTPNNDFHGTDSFTYQATDGTLLSNTATVTITVNHVNQAPVANDDSFTSPEEQTLSGNVLTNDTDADGNSLTAILNTGPSNGTFTLHTDGTFAYTPNPLFHGSDSFTYFATDGQALSNLATVNITVTFVNHPPVANDDTYTIDANQTLSDNVLTNDTDVDGQALSAILSDSPSNGTVTLHTNGIFTYSPNAFFAGTDSFTYFASDGQSESNLATVTITVLPVPTTPTNVAATPGNASAVVTWTAASGNGYPITGYVVTPYIGFFAQPSQTFNSAATTETVTGLTNGQKYGFKVTARNANGLGPQSTSSTAVTIGIPTAPTNVVATPGNHAATVQWTAAATNGSAIMSYTVTPYIGTAAQTSVTFNSAATTETLTGLTNTQTYTFKVAATNANGKGPQSAASPGITVGAPTAPGSVTAKAAVGAAKVSWTAPATNGSKITGYIVTVYSGTTVVKTVSFNTAATTETVSGLTKGHSYTFKVAANNANGTGPQSTLSNAVTPT